ERINLYSFISILYLFKVTGIKFVSELIKETLQNANETNVQLVVKSLSLCGYNLRKEDPVVLKDIMVLLSAVTADENQSFKTKFMIETLTNLKNNTRKLSLFDELVNRLHKSVLFITKKTGLKQPDPFNVSPADIRASSTTGKWWVVGAP